MLLERFRLVKTNFLVSSLRVYHVVSDSERESFQKIPGEKFRLGQGQNHDAENPKIL